MHTSFHQKLQRSRSEFFLTAIWAQNSSVCALAIILCPLRNTCSLWLVVSIGGKQTQEEEKLCWVNNSVWGIERILIYFVQNGLSQLSLDIKHICVYKDVNFQWKILAEYQYVLGKRGHIIQIPFQRTLLSTKKTFLKRQLFSSLAHLWGLVEVGHFASEDHHKVQRR